MRPIKLAQATTPDTAAEPVESAPQAPESKSAPAEDRKATESAAQPAETVKPIDDAKADTKRIPRRIPRPTTSRRLRR